MGSLTLLDTKTLHPSISKVQLKPHKQTQEKDYHQQDSEIYHKKETKRHNSMWVVGFRANQVPQICLFNVQKLHPFTIRLERTLMGTVKSLQELVLLQKIFFKLIKVHSTTFLDQ
jgi:hypothetical protein